MTRPSSRDLPRSAPLALLLVLLAGMAAGCGSGAAQVTSPAVTPQPSGATSATLLAARSQVLATLSAAGLQVGDARTPYRPGESAAVAAAPRIVVQAVLPAAPDAGFVVLYEFADPATASGAAQELAQYLASGPGRIQFPDDARFTVRQLGAALAFHAWSPGSSDDEEGERAIETALGTLGTGYPVLR